MGKIQVLSDLLANKIAAGEVVERPASVIKELLENAVDAQSTEIIVEIEQGGLDLIKVSDNGVGMEPEDALLAFERHATSKIKNEKDLFKIRTLGFRGEALPSIASVAKVEIKTRTQEANEGTLVKIEGGKLITQGVVAAKKGTEFAVRDLFFNTPARLKYLKSIQTELGHIIDYVNRLALAHPHISLRLYHNGRQLLQTPGDGKLLHAIAAIYGHDMARQMLPIEWANYDYKITGAVGFPELNRANRNHCSFIINGRYVKSYQLLNAVQAAYHTRLPINRYPVCVIAIELDPTLVDVNVHPNKLEVRFSEEKDVSHAVQTAVEEVLSQQTFIPKATAKPQQTDPQERTQQASLELNIPSSIRGNGGTGGAGDVGGASYTSDRTRQPYGQGFTNTPSSSAPLASAPSQNGPKYRDPLPNGGSIVRETPMTPVAKQQYQARREELGQPPRQQIDAAMEAYRREEVGQVGSAEQQGEVAERASHLSNEGNALAQQAVAALQAASQMAQAFAQAEPHAQEPSVTGTDINEDVTTGDSNEIVSDGTAGVTTDIAAEPPAVADQPRANVPQFRPVAQVLGMYVIAQDDTGLYIIDQHAAHEKVLYEKFTRKLQERTIQPLELLVPFTFELTASEAALLEQRIPDLAECQVEVEQFGGTTFIVRTVPDVWEGLELQALLQELIDELLQEGATPDPRRLIEAKVIMKACKSAIKANQWLSMPEMVALCDQLRELDNPFNCPHGRPIIIHMSNYDLEKQFKRVM